jgi:hypothetical protein
MNEQTPPPLVLLVNGRAKGATPHGDLATHAQQ